MDSGIKRFALMRLTHEIRANLTGKSMMISLGTVFGIIFIFTCIAKNIKVNIQTLKNIFKHDTRDRGII